MQRKNSLRGCVMSKWRASGGDATVQYEEVLAWARDCDHDLSRQGFNPAPEFRSHLERGDEQYLRTYLRGCRFPFRMVDDSIGSASVQQMVRSTKTLASNGPWWRACLKCGRLNLLDAVYCSYCGKDMPRDTKRE